MMSLTFLKEKDAGIVLSHPQKGFWVEYWAEMPAYIDYSDSDFAVRANVTGQIFYSRELERTFDLLESNSIKYVWIDDAMKSGQVWIEEDEGLLFLLRSERFKRVYYKDGIEIWRFD